MNTDRIKNRLAKANTANSVNTDEFLKINLVGNERLLPTNQINEIVDVAERFNVERQRCTYYRIIGTINPTVSNCLFNLTNPTVADNFYSYAGFNSTIFLDRTYPSDSDINDDEDLTFSKAINYHLKEKEGWFGFYDPDIARKALCNYFDMEPKRERFSFLTDYAPYNLANGTQFVKNWELTITYPFESVKNHKMVDGGLLIIDTNDVVVSTRPMTAFAVACKHNLAIGDTVRIKNMSPANTDFNGDHVVVRTGLDNGDLKDNYFVIDLPSSAGTLTSTARFTKLINGVESEYYFRKFKKIKTKLSPVIETDDYETYQAGFSENFYNDPIIQFAFNEDIDVSNLTDNLGRPLSQIYFTALKTSSNGLFTQVSSGIETPFISKLNNSNSFAYLLDIPVINKIHNGGSLPYQSHVPLENSVVIGNSSFYGDVVEYNTTTLIETVLADVMHRFNTQNRETQSTINSVTGPPLTTGGPNTSVPLSLGPRQEGYYYKPHHLIQIRSFSNYIEEGDAAVDELPPYSVTGITGGYIWRDLVDIGFNEGDEKPLDYPFLNNAHYMYQNYCFYIKRQDPYGLWGLLYTDFPSDAIGDRITDRFTVNSADDVC